MPVRAFAIWLLLMAAETLHGIARAVWLAPRVGDFRARQIAVFTGTILILGITTALVRWIRATGTPALLAVGVLWLALTLAFELALGRWTLHLSWERILSDYDLSRGGLLPIGLLVLTLSPWIAARLRARF